MKTKLYLCSASEDTELSDASRAASLRKSLVALNHAIIVLNRLSHPIHIKRVREAQIRDFMWPIQSELEMLNERMQQRGDL